MMDSSASDIEKLRREALHYYHISRYERAKSLFLEIIEEDPSDGWAYFVASDCCRLLGELDQAYNLCTTSLGKGYVNARAYVVLGLILMKKHAYFESEQAMLEALSINPNDAMAITAYAKLMFRTGHEGKANALLAEAKKRDPHNEYTLGEEFERFLILGKTASAEETLGQYMDSARSDINVLINSGYLELRKKQYRLAREHYLQAFTLDPTNDRVLRVLETLDRLLHPISLPVLMIDKIGGRWAFRIYAFIALILALALEYMWPQSGEIPVYTVMGLIIFFVFYPLVSPTIYKLYMSMRRR